jgi:hypothetical protein
MVRLLSLFIFVGFFSVGEIHAMDIPREKKTKPSLKKRKLSSREKENTPPTKKSKINLKPAPGPENEATACKESKCENEAFSPQAVLKREREALRDLREKIFLLKNKYSPSGVLRTRNVSSPEVRKQFSPLLKKFATDRREVRGHALYITPVLNLQEPKNIENMTNRKRPYIFGKDGNPYCGIALHHMDQKPTGPILMISEEAHRGKKSYAVIKPDLETNEIIFVAEDLTKSEATLRCSSEPNGSVVLLSVHFRPQSEGSHIIRQEFDMVRGDFYEDIGTHPENVKKRLNFDSVAHTPAL